MSQLPKSLLTAIALFILIAVFMQDVETDTPNDTILSKQEQQEKGIALKKETATLKRIVDGDTVIVTFSDGREERIRLLLIDTPESVHPSHEPEWLGKESSDYAKRYLSEGKQVTIEIGNPERDKYDRMLGYVWVDGVNFNQHMIEKGYARVAYVYPPNTKYLGDFEKAQEFAKKNKVGIWSVEGYVTDKGFNMSVIK